MKKFIVFLFVVALLGGIGYFIYNNVIKKEEQKLETPVVTLEENIVKWTSVENAEKYEINLDGVLFYLANTEISYKLNNGQSFSIRAISADEKILDSDWSEIVVCEYKETYTVTWMDGNKVLETDTDVAKGTFPSYDGLVPTREKTAEFTYEFIGWSPVITQVNGDAIYYAQYNEIRNMYSITWKNNGTLMYIENNIPYGTMPVYDDVHPYIIKDGKYYLSSSWNPSLDIVTGDATYDAIYDFDREKRTITFKDWDDSVIAVVVVDYKTTATCPITPSRDDYSFSRWDKDLTSVTENMEVKAIYEDLLLVKFVDYNGSVISVQRVAYGTAAVAPSEPTRKNYQFKGWDKDFSYVIEDIVITAQYSKLYNVYFYDYLGNLVSLEQVVYGAAAMSPSNVSCPEGYKFKSWDKDFNNITSDLIVNALYEICYYEIIFSYDNGNASIKTNVKYNETVEIPIISEYYFDFNHKKCYKFVGWDKEVSNAVENITYNAVYQVVTDQPVIVVENFNVDKGSESQNLGVYIYNATNVLGLYIELEYDTNLILTDNTFIKIDSPFNNESLYSYTLDIVKEGVSKNKFVFNWAYSHGAKLKDLTRIFNLTFSFDKYIDAELYLVELLSETYFINENYEKVTPIIISGGINIMED